MFNIFKRNKRASKADTIRAKLECERKNAIRNGQPGAAVLLGDLIKKRCLVVGTDSDSMTAENIARRCGCSVEYVKGFYQASISF